MELKLKNWVCYTIGLKNAEEFWERLGVKKSNKDGRENCKKKQWIPFKKYTGRQAFGFMKEAFFLTEKETIMWYTKSL